MDIKELTLSMIYLIMEFESDHKININNEVFIEIFSTLFEKNEEINAYISRGRITEDYVLKSLQIVLDRTIIRQRQNINETMYKEALARKDCDHYPWCNEPRNR